MDDTEYCYPNSDILINKLGIKDSENLLQGLSQREFIRELALHAGHKIDYSNISENEMVSASINSFRKFMNR